MAAHTSLSHTPTEVMIEYIPRQNASVYIWMMKPVKPIISIDCNVNRNSLYRQYMLSLSLCRLL